MHDAARVARVRSLDVEGLHSSEISQVTGVPRTTVRRWLKGKVPGEGWSGRCFRCDGAHRLFPALRDSSYSYLFGLYLGDGHVSSHARGVQRLTITLDRAYPGIVAECEAAMSLVLPRNTIRIAPKSDGSEADEVSAYSKHWACLLPQHAPGLKHDRPIELRDWQRAILDRWSWRFLRGLIHSDGCRSLNTIVHPNKTYRYPRYAFSNRSADIRDLFCEYCDRVKVEWRQMNQWNISVARRESVALMDRHIGPKR